MIVHLRGTLEIKEPTRLVLDVGGVGYEVFIPLSTYDRLPATGADCRLFTRHVVREDDELLFGFATEAERDLFGLVTTVSGIGPKIALAILSGFPVGELQLAIAEGNAKRLASVKGVGKKTAERLVVELKDKVNPIEALAASTAASDGAEKSGAVRDALLALTALGFTEDAARQQIQKVLEEEPGLYDTQALIRRALAGKS